MGTDKRERQKERRRMRLEAAADVQRRQARRRRVVFVAVLVLFVGGVALAYSVLSGEDETVATQSTTPEELPTTTAGETPCPPADGSAERTTTFQSAPPMCIDPAKTYTAVFSTNVGEIRVELDTDNTPETANNFAVLSRYHYYDDTAIFRTDPSIDIVQGGAPTTNDASDPGPGYTIEDEGSGYTYEPGQLVMARSGGPDSAGAQFFFVAGPNGSELDGQGTYVPFGNVVEGLEVVEQILASHEPDPDNQLGGSPAEPVIVESVTIEES
ncbi:MAG: peptidylprolyl isomerase [Acidimicrobiia bacterium]|nr:peptidylprolyl isomerase [Acidimicrobiia bacterium]